LVLIVLALCTGLVLVPAASATTFAVNTATDLASDGVCSTAANGCSVRDAFRAAQLSDSSSDTINIGQRHITLTLTGADEDANATGDLDLTGLDHDVIIQGESSSTSSISAGLGFGDGIIHITGSGSPRVTLNNIGVYSGAGTAGHGGCIDITDARVELSFVAVSTCTAPEGGAIRFESSIAANTLTISDSRFFLNEATAGPGGSIAMIGGRLNLQRSSIAEGAATSNGGGINFTNNGHTSRASIRDTHIERNFSDGYGGGISWGGSWNLTILNSSLIENRADDDNIAGGEGGALSGVSATVGNTLFTGNLGRDPMGSPVPNACAPSVTNIHLVAALAGHNVLRDNGEDLSCPDAGEVDASATLVSLALSGATSYRLSSFRPFGAASVLRDGGDPLICNAALSGTTASRDIRDGLRPVAPLLGTCDVGPWEFGGIAELGATVNIAPAGSITVGGTVTATVNISNAGPDASVGGQMVTYTAAGVSISNVVGSAGVTCGADPTHPGDCLLPLIPSGGTATVTMTVTGVSVMSGPALEAYVAGPGLDVPATDNDVVKDLTVVAPVVVPPVVTPPPTPPVTPVVPVTPTGPVDDHVGPLMALTAKTVTLDARGRAKLVVKCPAGEGTCTGNVVIDTLVAGTRPARPKRVVIGKASYVGIPEGTSRIVLVQITKAGRKLITVKKPIAAIAKLAAKDRFGNARTSRVKLTLKIPKPRPRS